MTFTLPLPDLRDVMLVGIGFAAGLLTGAWIMLWFLFHKGVGGWMR
jgi:hypothetical protein